MQFLFFFKYVRTSKVVIKYDINIQHTIKLMVWKTTNILIAALEQC